MSGELFAYIDESGDPNPAVPDPFCLGVLLSKMPFSSDFFSKAFSKLACDKDFEERDRITLDRGYFHASFDSKNAHSYCCRAINQCGYEFEFRFSKFDKSKIKNLHDGKAYDAKLIHRHCIDVLLLNETIFSPDTFIVNIADRPGSFSSEQVDSWEMLFIDTVLQSSLPNPIIPIRIPEIQVNLVDTSNSGMQSVDFLLWATQRNALQDDAIWLTRSGIKLSSRISFQGDPWLDEYYYHIKELEKQTHTGIMDIPAASNVGLILQHSESRVSVYSSIESSICSASLELDNVKNMYVKRLVRDACALIGNTHVNTKDIYTIACCYLLLVDSYPFYDLGDRASVERAYTCKHLCLNVAYRQNIDWFFWANDWIKCRKQTHA